MTNALFDSFNSYGKTTYEAIKDLYAVNSNLVEQLIEQQFAFATLGIEYTTNQMKLASTAKGYKEVLSGQSDLAAEMGSKIQGISRNTLDILNESKEELEGWFEKSVQTAEKSMKEVAKTVPTTKKTAK